MVEPDDRAMRALSRAELDHLLAVAARPPSEVHVPVSRHDSYRSPRPHDRYLALYHVLGHGGLRPSEALALTQDDLLPNGVRITKALVTGITGQKWSIDRPKTRHSRRIVTLPPETMVVLNQHLSEQERERVAASDRYVDRGFLFANEIGGPLDLKNITRRSFRPLLAAAELALIRLYDLRHTHISILLRIGVPITTVSARAGHANVTMTLNVYAHSLPEDHEDAMSAYIAAGPRPTLKLDRTA
jgi:integrase